MRIKCVCGKEMKEIHTKFEGFDVRGWTCGCGEELLNPVDVNAILKLKKAVKVGITAKIGKVGNNLVVRIPKVIETTYHFKAGNKITLEPNPNGVLIGNKD